MGESERIQLKQHDPVLSEEVVFRATQLVNDSEKFSREIVTFLE